MKKDIYLDKTNTNIIAYNPLKTFITDPITSTTFFKSFFEKEYTSTTKALRNAIMHNAQVVHIKNVRKKYYDVLTPYCGQVQVEGVQDLIYHMYGTIGIINTYPVLYQDEDKNIIRAVAPRYNSHNEFSSQSPFNDLDWHVDAAYRPMIEKDNLSPIPDYLIFGVVHKGHESLPITYIALDDILNQLSYKDILAGLNPEFVIASPDSFSNKKLSKNVPLLVKNNNGSFYSRITLQNSTPLTNRATDFLHKIREILSQKNIQNTVTVETGDIVILNNKTTLHKRDSYKPKWDGKDRYFIRIYSVKDLNQGILSDNNKQWIWI